VPFKDHFSKQSVDYAKFRPRYPAKIFEYLGRIAPARQRVWDCATGNGQAAIGLAAVFIEVVATDASENQIAKAQPHERVNYRVAPAEESGLENNSVDLIMVAQALHWFDRDRFYGEVNRVLKPQGVFAASAYRLFHVTPEIDELVNRKYYHDVVGPFWPDERKLIMQFEDIPFPFPELKIPPFEVTVEWTLAELLGYLGSWSATQRFIAANRRDPLEEIAPDLRSAWGDVDKSRRVVWPLTLRGAIKPAASSILASPQNGGS